MAKILITGGSGLIGRAVSELLVNRRHQPVWLSRRQGVWQGIAAYRWEPEQGFMDQKALEDVEGIIHLAGAGVIDKRWTRRYKQQIIDSRVKSSALLFDCLSKNTSHRVKTLVGASAVGYYGARQSSYLFTEEDFPGRDFLSKTCVLWEKGYEPFSTAGIRTSIIRTGIVLSRDGGLYRKIAPLFRLGLGSALGSGRQFMPWIHVKDAAALYLHLLFNEAPGEVYNGVASELTDNKNFSEQLAQSLDKPLFLPDIPAALLRLALGESAAAITEGLRISNQKIKDTGFKFEFDSLPDALKDLAG
jgi:uncharacterized protein (TIGR01777 family)